MGCMFKGSWDELGKWVIVEIYGGREKSGVEGFEIAGRNACICILQF